MEKEKIDKIRKIASNIDEISLFIEDLSSNGIKLVFVNTDSEYINEGYTALAQNHLNLIKGMIITSANEKKRKLEKELEDM